MKKTIKYIYLGVSLLLFWLGIVAIFVSPFLWETLNDEPLFAVVLILVGFYGITKHIFSKDA